jgi:hypothetical protein
MQMNQQVTFLSDGEEIIRDLQYYLNPNAEHILDWFHITMRITVMKQIAKGIIKEDLPAGINSESILKDLTSLKWYLWHGNVFKGLSKIEDLIDSTFVLGSDDDEREPSLEAQKLCSHLESLKPIFQTMDSIFPIMANATATANRFPAPL